ncbi:MAG: hypothetical protein JWN44_5228 [Myxococcales bacterium]|nr:hypothetical protein [Myxococcales bacterium]
MKSISVTFLLSSALVVSAALMLAAALSGCHAAPTAPPAPRPLETPAQLALGAPAADGSSAMVPFVDGQDAELVAGAQGGFHVWMQLALKDVPAGATINLERTAHRLSDDAVVLRFDSSAVVGELDPDGWFRSPTPFPMFMCPTPIGISVVDTPVVFQVRVSDESGATDLARAAVTLVPRCPESRRDLCARICTG